MDESVAVASGDPPRGLFVVLEGIDGAGKSEQARRLAAWLRARDKHVVETREPTSGEWGQRYRAWARGESQAEPEEVLHFFSEDRREHVAQVIRPALERGAVVVCDRYVASTLAYQAAQGLGRERVRKRMDAGCFPEPDLVLWLRVPIELALARMGAQATERFERETFLESVDAQYQALGLTALDGVGSQDQVARRVCERVAGLLGGTPSPV